MLSPIGFSMLSGAGLFNGSDKQKTVHVHTTATVTAEKDNELDLSGVINTNTRKASSTKIEDQKEVICATAPIFVMPVEADGSIIGSMVHDVTVGAEVSDKNKLKTAGSNGLAAKGDLLDKIEKGVTYFVDFYVMREATDVTELQIDMKKFGGYFYVEASTLFRDQETGVDMPAEITFPNVKIQSNFTFNMASTGDPSTFSFTMDAFPGYTAFDNTKKVLCCIQVVNDTDTSSEEVQSVMAHSDGEKTDSDSVPTDSEKYTFKNTGEE